MPSAATRRLATLLLALTLAVLALAAGQHGPFPLIQPALADDGDGDGGSGGSGGAGASGSSGDGGFDAWNPSRGAARRGGRCRCQTVLFFRTCSCSSASARRRTREAAAPSRAAEPTRRAREIVVVGLTPDQIAALEARGFVERARLQSALLGRGVARLALPRNLSERRALAQVRSLAPMSLAAPNHLYARTRLNMYREAGQPCGERCEAFDATSWTATAGRCTAGVAIGVVDTAVDTSHPSLATARVTTKTVRSPDRPASDSDHGTGVVSLLSGPPETPVVGLAYGASVFAADAFHAAGDSSMADTFDLVNALDWLTESQVRLLNMSLTGPDNAVLEAAVRATLAKGVVVVAAAGRPDKGNKLGFPARYEGVVAVSAVDARLRPSRLSAKGRHIAFAAPGVGLVVAGANGGLRKVDGTSFAAPFVTAAYAHALAQRLTPDKIARLLVGSARDLGAPGRDDTFGWGLVQFAARRGC